MDIDHLAKLPHAVWKKISSEITWLYRRKREGVPPHLRQHITSLPPTRAAWIEVRAQIIAERRRLQRVEKLKQLAKRAKVLEKRAEFRREYMRVYMQKYRAQAD